MSRINNKNSIAQEQVPWWQSCVIYQVYPRSFCEERSSNEKHIGSGTIKGVTSKLEYIRNVVHANAVWLCPIFDSPMDDNGYDVRDYRSINPEFGTMRDFEELVQELQRLEMHLILDFVPNHTSDQHLWFQESRLRKNGRDDWYIWEEGDNTKPPNNWVCTQGGPAWTFDEARKAWYMHTFMKSQPDLNLRSPQVVQAVLSEMQFWVEKGVEGFRLDALKHIFKDKHLRDEPVIEWPYYDNGPVDPGYNCREHIYTTHLKEVHEFLRELRNTIGRKAFLVGESWDAWDRVLSYYGAPYSDPTLAECHAMLNFDLITLSPAQWDAVVVRNLVEQTERYTNEICPGAWPTWTLGNHDSPRIASRLGEPTALLAAALLLTLRGTPIIYNGDELAMLNGEGGKGDLRNVYRTPMPFDRCLPAGGFTQHLQSWIPLSRDWQTRNVELQSKDPKSPLSAYSSIANTRASSLALQIGAYRTISEICNEQVFAFAREHDEECVLVLLNISGSPATVTTPISGVDSTTILTQFPPQDTHSIQSDDVVVMQPWSVLILQCTKSVN